MGRNEFYNYTPDGNRSMRSILAGSMQSEQYQYYPNSDLLQYDGTYYYAYDENGNLTERGDSATITGTKITINRTLTYRHYSWDLLNRLENVEELDEEGNLEVIKEYGYDVNNLRIWEKNRHGQITHYVYDQKGNRIERHTDERSEYYIFRNLRHIAKRVVDHSTNTEKIYFYGTDHLGSTVLMTDEDGNEVFSAETTPFGDSVSELGPMADTEHLMYTGKDLDEDTGLYYFNARWYDPGTGRFISEDPARFGSNWYRYAASNPLKYFDPTGLNEVSWGTSIFDAGEFHTESSENYENAEETTTEVATYEDLTEQINHVSTGISTQDTITRQTEKLAELSQQDTSGMTIDEFLAFQQEMQDLAKELLQGIQDYEAAGYDTDRVLTGLALNESNGHQSASWEINRNTIWGIAEIIGGGTVIGLSWVSAASLAPTTGGTSAMVGYNGTLFGSALLAHGLNRVTGNTNQTVIEDLKQIITPPIAELGKIRTE